MQSLSSLSLAQSSSSQTPTRQPSSNALYQTGQSNNQPSQYTNGNSASNGGGFKGLGTGVGVSQAPQRPAYPTRSDSSYSQQQSQQPPGLSNNGGGGGGLPQATRAAPTPPKALPKPQPGQGPDRPSVDDLRARERARGPPGGQTPVQRVQQGDGYGNDNRLKERKDSLTSVEKPMGVGRELRLRNGKVRLFVSADVSISKTNTR